MKVNVLMTAYNHENFIAEAIESILLQKTDFEFKVIIGEDCSTDKTRQIVIDYANKYPDKIQLVLREKNYGLMPNFIDLLKTCDSSEYLAWLEGDDYWTDTLKLQKQIDFLESHSDFSVSSHNANVVMDKKIVKQYCPPNHPEVMDLEYLLTYGSTGPTCSLVIRNEAIKNLPSWFWQIHAGDWAIQIVAAQQGKIKYFKEIMGVYRRHGQGALYASKKEARSKGESDFCLPAKYTLEMIELLDQYFNYKYSQKLNIQKTYWYDLYISSYLEIGDWKNAKVYYFKILKQIFSVKFLQPLPITLKRILKLSVLMLPTFLLKNLLKKYVNN